MSENENSEGNNSSPDWKSEYIQDEGVRNHASMQNVPDVGTLAKNYVNQQELIGRKGVILPKNENDADGWNSFYKTIGRPDDISGYKSPDIQVDDKVKDFVDFSNLDTFKQIAHESGLTQKQFDSIVTKYGEHQVRGIQSALDKRAEQQTMLSDALNAKWGENSEKNSQLADRVLDTYGKDIDQSALNDLKQNPYLREILANVGGVISDDSFVPSDGKSETSVESIDAELNQMLTDTEGAFRNGMHKDHDKALKRYNELHDLKLKLKAG